VRLALFVELVNLAKKKAAKKNPNGENDGQSLHGVAPSGGMDEGGEHSTVKPPLAVVKLEVTVPEVQITVLEMQITVLEMEVTVLEMQITVLEVQVTVLKMQVTV